MSSTDDDHRARLERLLAAADRVVAQEVRPRRERPYWLPYAVLTVGGVAMIGVLVFTGGKGEGTRTPAPTTLVPPGPTGTPPPIVITLSPTTVPVIVPSTSTTISGGSGLTTTASIP